MNGYYILDGHRAVPATVLKWVEWYETADRRVASTELGALRVSTVFLGLDHNFGGLFAGGSHEPHIFETMIFGLDEHDESYQTRCSTWEQAEEMHAAAVAVAMAVYLPTKDVLEQALDSFDSKPKNRP